MSQGRILIVDDNATGREFLRDTIELEGEYEVLTVPSGQEALEVAELDQPHLILMDLHMPQMDGYETTQQLKANRLTAHIPVIAMTASRVTADDRRQAEVVGCVDYVQKPVPRFILLEKIKQHLRR